MKECRRSTHLPSIDEVGAAEAPAVTKFRRNVNLNDSVNTQLSVQVIGYQSIPHRFESEVIITLFVETSDPLPCLPVKPVPKKNPSRESGYLQFTVTVTVG